MLVRLNKFLAQGGAASRRRADGLIVQGRVAVNGRVVVDLGTKVDSGRDRVTVDGKPVRRGPAAPVYLLLHKPPGFLVTLDDPYGRRTVRDLISGLPDGVFPVGRLDKDSEGLLLLTNDGEMAYRLTHPRFEVVKRYVVRIRGEVSEAEADKIVRGVPLGGGRTSPARVKVFERSAKTSILQVEIHEGRKREVRRMLAALGHDVLELKRVSFAGLALSHLPAGKWRSLTVREVDRLRRLVGLTSEKG
jgi:23S rRNA pseudouridine2605 synthase